MKPQIENLRAYEILDSRGRPTVAVEAVLSDGVRAVAQVPSGVSTGVHEAVELRDGDPNRYDGRGVLKAVENVKTALLSALRGLPAYDQARLDRTMIELDGTSDKSRLGANAILGVSCAVARAAAVSQGVPLWQWLAAGRETVLPVPMVNILSGGLHADGNIELQDFLAVPAGFASYADALEAIVRVHGTTRRLLEDAGYQMTGVADEGGWGPRLASNEEALDILVRAVAAAGFQPGGQISIAIDVASSHFFRDGFYRLETENRILDAAGMIDLLGGWCERYPVVAVEDGLHEDDWSGWRILTGRLGGRVQLVGDDLFTTNPHRVRKGLDLEAANAVLVKMNQIGTLTETFEVVDLARSHGWRAVISARSGETEDPFLADLAVASGAGQIKIGSVTRSERLAKYNRLLEIEKTAGLRYGAGS